MFGDLALFPEAASTMASEIDKYYIFMVSLSAIMALLIAIVVFYFTVRYHRRSDDEVPEPTVEIKALEITWIVVPFVVFMFMFFWSAHIFFQVKRMPVDTLDIHVVGKQWMWKFQHPGGRSEINDLHVPVGKPVKLTMASEDVIHDFYVPQFRVHMDVLPARYTQSWFEATRTGVYNIFCSEYCGTEHSRMIGKIYVMEPGEYQRWLAGGEELSPAAEGERLFQKMACDTCHFPDDKGRGPSLIGVVGATVNLSDGSSVKVDEAYLRESILNPRARIVAEYEAIMPSFQGQLSEEQVLQLISYLKSLGPPDAVSTGLAGEDAGS